MYLQVVGREVWRTLSFESQVRGDNRAVKLAGD